jgi:hypothetical protein
MNRRTWYEAQSAPMGPQPGAALATLASDAERADAEPAVRPRVYDTANPETCTPTEREAETDD